MLPLLATISMNMTCFGEPSRTARNTRIPDSASTLSQGLIIAFSLYNLTYGARQTETNTKT